VTMSPMIAGLGLMAVVVLSGCVPPGSGPVDTMPFVDSEIETPPAPDPDPIEEAVVDEVVFGSLSECLEGNWAVDNDAFAQFFAQTDDRVTSIDVSGVATIAVEGSRFRMFFDDWDIRYDTGEPSFLLVRGGNETVDFVLGDEDQLEVVERDDQIVFEMFALLGGDGEGVAIATNDPGFLPFDGATLACTASAVSVTVDGEAFILNRL
jgi:hypothetical protein